MTKQESNIMKGLAILLMYIHHVFYDEGSFQGYDIEFGAIGMQNTIEIAKLSKICVAIFVFVTAYGITKQFMEKEIKTPKEIMKYSMKKYWKLMVGFWFIFAVALAASFVFQRHLYHEVYGTGGMALYYFVLDFFGMAFRFGSPTYNATWWYLSFAIILIFLMPIFIKLYDRVGLLMIPLAFFAPIFLNANDNVDSVFAWYFMGIVFGVVLAKSCLLESIKKNFGVFQKVLLIVCAFFAGAGLCFLRVKGIWRVSAIDNLIVVCIVLFTIVFSGRIPLLDTLFEKLGSHSMNLFLLHTFVKTYFLRDFTYSWKYPWLIILVLLFDTFLISCGIEILKKLLHVEMLEKKLLNMTYRIIEIIC